MTRPGRCLFIAAILLRWSQRGVVQGSDRRGHIGVATSRMPPVRGPKYWYAGWASKDIDGLPLRLVS